MPVIERMLSNPVSSGDRLLRFARNDRWLNPSGFAAVGCTSSVGTPQVPLRTVITLVPGLRPVRTSETSTPA